jgi:hypothetical protein
MYDHQVERVEDFAGQAAKMVFQRLASMEVKFTSTAPISMKPAGKVIGAARFSGKAVMAKDVIGEPAR